MIENLLSECQTKWKITPIFFGLFIKAELYIAINKYLKTCYHFSLGLGKVQPRRVPSLCGCETSFQINTRQSDQASRLGFLDRELTKCAVLGIDMLLLLLGICQAKMEFNAL